VHVEASGALHNAAVRVDRPKQLQHTSTDQFARRKFNSRLSTSVALGRLSAGETERVNDPHVAALAAALIEDVPSGIFPLGSAEHRPAAEAPSGPINR
jgi:hypothetical protein